jgi:hypothetical protein
MNTSLSVGRHFAVFRILFGAYLCLHFIQLFPHAGELFSREGMLADYRVNFTAGLLPNPLEKWDTPAFCRMFVGMLSVVSCFLAAGVLRRSAALLLWFGWACLFNRNNLISNPSLPYVGLLLLLCVIVPTGEPWRLGRRRPGWEMPAMVPVTAWILLAAGYTFSGLWKLSSPSWLDGSALWHVLQNPLARPIPARDWLLSLPPQVLQLMTWSVLAAEVLFLPMCLHLTTRRIAWPGMAVAHVGILLMLDFADLTFGMLMIHLFTLPGLFRASGFPAPALPFSPDSPRDALPDRPAPH